MAKNTPAETPADTPEETPADTSESVADRRNRRRAAITAQHPAS